MCSNCVQPSSLLGGGPHARGSPLPSQPLLKQPPGHYQGPEHLMQGLWQVPSAQVLSGGTPGSVKSRSTSFLYPCPFPAGPRTKLRNDSKPLWTQQPCVRWGSFDSETLWCLQRKLALFLQAPCASDPFSDSNQKKLSEDANLILHPKTLQWLHTFLKVMLVNPDPAPACSHRGSCVPCS